MNRPTDRSPVPILVLARLLAAGDKGETEKTLSKDLLPLVKHRWEGREWVDRLGSALDELESAGVFHKLMKGKTTRLALTDEGRRAALDALGIDELPTRTTWAKLKTSSLPALALGRAGSAVGNLKAEILRSHYDLDLGEGKPTIPQATEHMAAKLMGLEPGQKFNVDTILRKLLEDAGVAFIVTGFPENALLTGEGYWINYPKMGVWHPQSLARDVERLYNLAIRDFGDLIWWNDPSRPEIRQTIAEAA